MGGLKSINEAIAQIKQDPVWSIILEATTSTIAGVAFGAALTAAGVHLPGIIQDQFKLSNFRMFQVFSVALGTSVFAINILDRFDIVKRHVRPNTSLGLFSQYDGNIIGGALVGLGMSMSGSCPGTVTAQLGQSIPTAWITAFGGLMGGMTHLWFVRPPKHVEPAKPAPSKPSLTHTISEATGISETVLHVAVGAMWLGLIYASATSTSAARLQSFIYSPAAGGLYLGIAQVVSLLATSTPLGASGMYDQAGRYAWRSLGNRDIDAVPSVPRSLLFGLGAIGGSILLTRTLPHFGVVSSTAIAWPAALFGGFFMALGAKIAKGCTSGHGLSGMGAFSFPSLITVAAMFGTGIASQQIWR